MTLAKNTSPFLLKLFNIVDDPLTDDLIHWTSLGNAFVIEDQEELAKSVLPKFFKSKNFSSFVRQLNMYAFYKVPHLTHGTLGGSSDDNRWEFMNEYFKRGQPDLLCMIQRKKAGVGGDDDSETATLLNEMTAVRKHQLTLSSEQKELQAYVHLLWRELTESKEVMQRQQGTIDKIMKFLTTMY
ncbi:hypothetical protein BC828DRAFT_349184, partial [Blastocladiella britannica]